MERISRDELNIKIAGLIALRATCERGQVGCVITQNNRIVSTGYNGPIVGHSCQELHCKLDEKCDNATHAEINAITAAAKFGIPLDGSTLYCTTSPCKNCAMAIIQSGIQRVVFDKEYRSDEGTMLLFKSGITVCQIS